MTKTTTTIITLLSSLMMVVCINAAAWNVTSWEFATIAAAVSFSSEMKGIAPISDNGQGSGVLETHDGGATWNQDKSPEVAMYMAGASIGDAAVVSGMLNMQFSSSQQAGYYNFSSSLFDEGITSQSAGPMKGTKGSFGVVGATVLGGNGVATTDDAGATFKWNNISVLKTEARYGAFPSANTWFISAGEWPNNQRKNPEATEYQLSARWKLTPHNHHDGRIQPAPIMPGEVTAPGNATGWKAQIAKTTDGGKTWTSVYYSEGLFYFNGISCWDENNCAAVGEADSSSAPGTYIFTTNNGGANWTQTFHSTNPADSLMAVAHVSATELWAAGGTLSSADFAGNFYHSTDGGKTWNNNVVKGVYGNDIAVGSSNRLYATAFNYMDVSSFLVYS